MLQSNVSACTPCPGALDGSTAKDVGSSVQLHPALILTDTCGILIDGNSAPRKENHFQIKLGWKRSAVSRVKYQLKNSTSTGLVRN